MTWVSFSALKVHTRPTALAGPLKWSAVIHCEVRSPCSSRRLQLLHAPWFMQLCYASARTSCGRRPWRSFSLDAFLSALQPGLCVGGMSEHWAWLNQASNRYFLESTKIVWTLSVCVGIFTRGFGGQGVAVGRVRLFPLYSFWTSWPLILICCTCTWVTTTCISLWIESQGRGLGSARMITLSVWLLVSRSSFVWIRGVTQSAALDALFSSYG